MQFKFKLSLAFVCNIPYKYGFHYNELFKKIEWEMKPFRPRPMDVGHKPKPHKLMFSLFSFLFSVTLSQIFTWYQSMSIGPCLNLFIHIIFLLLMVSIFEYDYLVNHPLLSTSFCFPVSIENITSSFCILVILPAILVRNWYKVVLAHSIGLMFMIMPCILPT